jgi:hypothetical protein
MYMIVFVLDDPNQLDPVLEAWQAAGVAGITIIESTGVHRRQAHRPGAPFVLTFHRLLGSEEESHYTLFAIVEGEEVAQRCLAATEKIVGDLDEPNTGVLAAWPLALAKGVAKPEPDQGGG